jgi:hypothetical protein
MANRLLQFPNNGVADERPGVPSTLAPATFDGRPVIAADLGRNLAGLRAVIPGGVR